LDGGFYGFDRSGSGYRQLAGSCKCGDETSEFKNEDNFLSSLGLISFSAGTLLQGVSRNFTSYVAEENIKLVLRNYVVM
jgi:hypothetical protein